MLEQPSNELWLSPVSTWEIVLLLDSGHIRIRRTFEEWLAGMTASFGLHEAPLTHEVVFASREVRLPHNDPADRLIAATAGHYGLQLVTADERLRSGSGYRTVAWS